MNAVHASAVTVFAALFLTLGCDRPSIPGSSRTKSPSSLYIPGLSQFSPSNAWSEVQAFVNLGPRSVFSGENTGAAAHIETRLKTHGLAPAIDVFADMTPQGPRVFRNVTVELPGATGLVVLVSHYDTKSGIGTNFVGANDSGSSTGLLIELARCLKTARTLPVGVLIAFLDGEECLQEYGPQDGLHGSRRLAHRLQDRKSETHGVIVLDMIGDRDLTIAIPRNSSASLMNLAFRAAHSAGVREHFCIAEGAVIDDHVPFLQAGIRAVDLIDFQYGSEPGSNNYWHTPADTLDKLSSRSLEIVGKVVLYMVATVSAQD